jgi:hypothetical protein
MRIPALYVTITVTTIAATSLAGAIIAASPAEAPVMVPAPYVSRTPAAATPEPRATTHTSRDGAHRVLLSEDVAPAPVTSGTGWQLISAAQTTSLAPTTYAIQFDSAAARTKLTPYLKIAAANTQAHTPGVKFVVSTTLQKRVTTGCQKAGTIVVSLEYRPMGKKGFSWGGNCYRTTDHSLFAGVMRIDTEWFYSHWFSTNATTNTYRIRNSVTHEFGHAIGLGHPNRDLNHDGKVSDYECKLNTDKTRPLMCSPNGGAVTKAGAGNYTALDLPGLKALVANYSLVSRSA